MALSELEQQIVELRAHAEMHDHLLYALCNGLLPADANAATKTAFLDNIMLGDIIRYLDRETAKQLAGADEVGRAFFAAMARQVARFRATTREAWRLAPEQKS